MKNLLFLIVFISLICSCQKKTAIATPPENLYPRDAFVSRPVLDSLNWHPLLWIESREELERIMDAKLVPICYCSETFILPEYITATTDEEWWVYKNKMGYSGTVLEAEALKNKKVDVFIGSYFYSSSYDEYVAFHGRPYLIIKNPKK